MARTSVRKEGGNTGNEYLEGTRTLRPEKILTPTHGGKNLLVTFKINRLKERDRDIVVIHVRLLSKPGLEESWAFL